MAKQQKQAPGSVDERALDTLADVLRALGEWVLVFANQEAERIRLDFEGWARHALVGAPRPGLDDPESREQRPRDWKGLTRFVREHRRGEVEHVQRMLQDLRQVIWTFVQGIGNAIIEDRRAGREVENRLDRLRLAVDSDDTELLKREALASISLIQHEIERRKRLEQGQIEALSTQLDQLANELMQVKEQLSVDPLTQIWNRAALDEHIKRVVSLGAVLGQPAILFMIDIDDFKWVNDRYGHPAGDEVLRQVAATLAHTLRRKGDIVARYGGDEFTAVILDDSLETAEAIGERMLFGVRELDVELEDQEEPIRVSISVGVARLASGEDAESWFDRADRALYQAKERGRDRVAFAIDAPADGREAAARGSDPD